MTDANYHFWELVILGLPLWGGFLYLIFVSIFYPPHRHIRINGHEVIEYPPKMAPGRADAFYRVKGE